MASLKDLLIRQTSVPGGIEARLPAGIPKISSFMASAVKALPDLPNLPIPGLGGGMSLPGLPFSTGVKGMPGDITGIIKGIEDALPTGMPKLGEATGKAVKSVTTGGYRPIEGPGAPRVATAGPILGGGYRSI